jgi:hypothetical protein
MIAAIVVIAAAGAVAAEAPLNAPTARVSAPWKISGVGLGMTPAEVAAVLKQDGYKLSYRYTGRSWQGEVANQVLNLRSVRIPAGAEVTSKEDYRVGQEQVHVTYTPGRAGPYVSRVHYKIHSSAIEAESFQRAVLSRYGQPSLKWQWESLYCAAGEPRCSRTGSLVTNQLPTLTVRVMDVMSRSLELRQGQRADRAYEAAIRAEVERLDPKMDKPLF